MVKKLKIPYARGYMEAAIADSRVLGILESRLHAQPVLSSQAAEDSVLYQETLVREALENPIGSPRLSELARDKRNIVIITSDHTRPVPSRILSPLLIAEIQRTNPTANITFLIATGFHRASTREELLNKFGEDLLSELNVVMHDCQDDSGMVKLGTLPSGGELIVNRLVTEADLLVAEGFIEPHFFAGFSGGRKSILPGVASKVTVLANHCAKFIASEQARAGNLVNNPLHTDMVYAADKAKLAFIVNVVLDAEKKIIKAVAGDRLAAHEAGCRFVAELASVKARPADIVITSNGGYPLDQNLYQAVKGMAAAERTVRKGGVIIICAACNDGHGGEAFYQWFSQAPGGAQEVMEKILQIDAQNTVADQWEAQILARIQLKAHVIVVTDRCDHQVIREMHMQAAATLQEALHFAEIIVGSEATVTVIPDGISVIVQD